MHLKAQVQDRSEAVHVMNKILEIWQLLKQYLGVLFTRVNTETSKRFFRIVQQFIEFSIIVFWKPVCELIILVSWTVFRIFDIFS